MVWYCSTPVTLTEGYVVLTKKIKIKSKTRNHGPSDGYTFYIYIHNSTNNLVVKTLRIKASTWLATLVSQSSCTPPHRP